MGIRLLPQLDAHFNFMGAVKKNLIGKKFFKLLVIEFIGNDKNGFREWLCKCECGNETKATTNSLNSKHKKSCGCWKRKVASDRWKTHGMSQLGMREYQIWYGIVNRCKLNKNYVDRISVCQRWINSFEDFLADMGKRPSPKHSIERRDNDGNYEPDNCYWATRYQQNRNHRRNVWIEHEKEKMIITDWAKRFGVSLDTLKWHLKTKSMDEIVEFYKNKRAKK